MNYSDDSEESFPAPDGFCHGCGQPWFGEPHNHEAFGTVSPAECVSMWEGRRCR